MKESLLPKADRNLSGKKTAMIYKEGVLYARWKRATNRPCFDYNFHGNELRLDESA